MIDSTASKAPNEEGDHSVPFDLLELHMDLEDAGVTAADFKELFNHGAEEKS